MAAIPFHQHPARHELIARASELCAAVFERSARDGKAWATFLDPDACIGVFEFLAEHEDLGGLRCAIVNDSHLIAYCIAPMWFAPTKPLLVEHFFMRVGRGSSDEAMEQIKQLGRDSGCAAVLMATMLAPDDEALGRLYQRAGGVKHSSQYLMELH
jgi:hypothetical protein